MAAPIGCTPRAEFQAWAIYRSGGDRDLGAAQMDDVANRLPVPIVQAAMVRYGFVDA
jgi:hypothetical protein